jgi:hypothetical protein
MRVAVPHSALLFDVYQSSDGTLLGVLTAFDVGAVPFTAEETKCSYQNEGPYR